MCTQRGTHVDPTWNPCGRNVNPTWTQCEPHVDPQVNPIWTPCVPNVEPMWSPKWTLSARTPAHAPGAPVPWTVPGPPKHTLSNFQDSDSRQQYPHTFQHPHRNSSTPATHAFDPRQPPAPAVLPLRLLGSELSHSFDMDASPCCWICLGDEADYRGRLPEVICGCSTRPAHATCMSRWRLQRAGTSEEKTCRFCLQDHKTAWDDDLIDDDLRTSPIHPVMAVVYEGITHMIQVKSGPEGKAEFERTVKDLFGFPQSWAFDVAFDVNAPGEDTGEEGQGLTLKGIGAFDAAARCAKATAASRALKQRDGSDKRQARDQAQKDQSQGRDQAPRNVMRQATPTDNHSDIQSRPSPSGSSSFPRPTNQTVNSISSSPASSRSPAAPPSATPPPSGTRSKLRNWLFAAPTDAVAGPKPLAQATEHWLASYPALPSGAPPPLLSVTICQVDAASCYSVTGGVKRLHN
eukprot:gene19477-26138_t